MNLEYYRDLLNTKDKTFKIVYTGKGISVNEFYNKNHWIGRKQLVDKYHPIFQKLIDDNMPEMNILKYSLIIYYNSRHDPDNVIGTGKVFVDVLRGKSGGYKFLGDDNKKYCKFIGIVPDENLPHNTFELNLIVHQWQQNEK